MNDESLKLVYLTDAHLGWLSAEGLSQRAYANRLGELFDWLRGFCEQHDVRAVLYGGDNVHHGTVEEIERFLGYVKSVGVEGVICLGNHDVEAAGSLAHWERLVDEAEGVVLGDAHVAYDECDVYVLNNAWEGLRPVWGEGQLAWLERLLVKNVDRPAVVMVHGHLDNPGEGLGIVEQHSHWEVDEDYVRPLVAVLNRHPQVVMTLAGHLHFNYATGKTHRVQVTSTAFCEVPHEVKLIEVREKSIEMSTHEVGMLPGAEGVDEGNRVSLGRGVDRGFVIPVCMDC